MSIIIVCKMSASDRTDVNPVNYRAVSRSTFGRSSQAPKASQRGVIYQITTGP